MPSNLLAMRFLSESIASARTRLQTAAGATFGGMRNIAKALGYKDKLDVNDYLARYQRNPIARRVVDSLPKATWKGIGELIEDEDPTVITAFEEAWFELSYRLKVWPMFNRADRASGIGQFSVLLIGAPGLQESELPQAGADGKILYLAVHRQGDIEVAELEKDPGNERYGLPKMYTLKGKRVAGGGPDRKLHWTRCIHIADSLLDNEVYAEPRLESVWNNLDDLDKIVGGGAEAFWLRAHQGYQFDVDPSVVLDEDGEKEFAEEVDEFMHGMRRALRTRGVTVTTLGSDTADFGPNVDAVLKLISSGSTIPLRLLVGSERGELASSQDRDNWAERINDRRTEFAEPFVVRPFIDRLIQYGYLPEPVWYDVRWPVAELSDTERAALAVRLAEINQKAGETVVTADEIRDRALALEPLDDDALGLEDEEPNVEDIEVEDSLTEDRDELIAAVKSLRAMARRRRLYGTALDKRRRWWRRKRGRRQPVA